MLNMQEKSQLPPEKPLYSIIEATQLLSVSDDTIRRMIQKKELDAVKVGGRWKIRKESIDQYLRGKQS